MDRIREARFVIAPFIFFISLLVGGYLDNSWSEIDIETREPQTLVAISAIIAASHCLLDFSSEASPVSCTGCWRFFFSPSSTERGWSPGQMSRHSKRSR